MIDKEKLVEIGKFQKTHALKGELNAILDIPEEYVKDGNPLIIETDGIPVPYYAESIRGKGTTSAEFVNSAILVPRDELQDYVGDVMLEDDLEGFKVIDRLEGEIGTLEFIDDTTENELMVVRTPDDEEIYIPLADEFIIDINEERREIHTSLPEGLVSLNKSED